jgi:ABC-type multidrug transport system ATPase subunit
VAHGKIKDRLEILKGVSGCFRPGMLTALMGFSGAGKTSLLDVLGGQKTTGYPGGVIIVSGYPKLQETFSHVLGYCEKLTLLQERSDKNSYSCYVRSIYTVCARQI